MKNNSLIKKSGIYLVGNMASKILTSVLVPIYAFYITTDDLGYFDYSQTITNIIIPIAFLSIWEAILKFILTNIEDSHKKEKVLATSALFTIVMSCILFIGTWVFIRIYSTEVRYIYYIFLMILFHGLAQVWQYCSRALGYNRIYTVSGVIATLVNFLSVLILVCIMKLGIVGLYISYIIGQFFIIFIVEFKVKIIENLHIKNIDLSLLKNMLRFSSPLVLNTISLWFVQGFGRLIITNVLGTSTNGLYTFANKFAQLVTMLGSVVTMAMVEEAIQSTNDVRFPKEFSKTINNLFKLFQTIIIIVFPIISIFYAVIDRTDYSTSLGYVPLLLIYSVFMTVAQNIGSIFQAIDKTKYQFITTIIGALFTVGLSVLLIGKIGVYGVLVGQIAGALAMVISRILLARKFVKIRINIFNMITGTVIFALTFIISLQINTLANFVFFILIFTAVCWFNKEIINKVIKKISKVLSKNR